jgi:chromosome segregation ATPase
MPKITVKAHGPHMLRRAGLVLTSTPTEHEVTEEQLQALKADKRLEVVEGPLPEKPAKVGELQNEIYGLGNRLQAVSEERNAYKAQAEALLSENAALKDQLARLTAAPAVPQSQLPLESDGGKKKGK